MSSAARTSPDAAQCASAAQKREPLHRAPMRAARGLRSSILLAVEVTSERDRPLLGTTRLAVDVARRVSRKVEQRQVVVLVGDVRSLECDAPRFVFRPPRNA